MKWKKKKSENIQNKNPHCFAIGFNRPETILAGAPRCPPVGHTHQLHPGLCFQDPKAPSLSRTQACSHSPHQPHPFLPRPAQWTIDPLVLFGQCTPNGPGRPLVHNGCFLWATRGGTHQGPAFKQEVLRPGCHLFQEPWMPGLTSRDSELNGQEGACTPESSEHQASLPCSQVGSHRCSRGQGCLARGAHLPLPLCNCSCLSSHDLPCYSHSCLSCAI